MVTNEVHVVSNCNDTTLKLLKEYGADINETNDFGDSLFGYFFMTQIYKKSPKYVQRDDCLWPFRRNYKYIISSLIAAGADVSFKNNSNHVPLRLAIDCSSFPSGAAELLIPTVDILNDDSLWDGPVLDYVLKSTKNGCGDLAIAMIKGGANRVSTSTLTRAIDKEDCSAELLQLLTSKLGCRATFKNFEKVVNPKHPLLNEHLFPAGDPEVMEMVKLDFPDMKEFVNTLKLMRVRLYKPLLTNGDDEMVTMVKLRYPSILIEVSEFFNDMKDSDVTKLITTLVNKFGIDVNFKKVRGNQTTLLHELIKYSFHTGQTSSLESVLAMDTLRINETIKINDTFSKVDMSALDYAFHIGHFKAAELLIENFADMKRLATSRFAERNGFARSFKLLSVLGHKIGFDRLKEVSPEEVNQELGQVENWISERAKKVLTLKELSALRVRRHGSKQKINNLVKNFEIPKELQDILFLKGFE